ncbi:MAG: hypothetical protein IKA70_03580 [Alistipes sp.]|nr:hypothetical protein [Alistipes sp.]
MKKMTFKTTSNYVVPTIKLMAVRCESGFLNSTGGIEFEDGNDDGWVY